MKKCYEGVNISHVNQFTLNFMNNLYLLTQTAAPYFRNQGIKIHYKKGQLFVRPEDSAQGIYYLVSGQVLIYATKTDGSEQIIGIFEKGAIFGKVGSVIAQPFTTISIQALSDCIVYRLDCQQFQILLKKENSVFNSYMKQVSFNNVYILNQILILGEKNIYLRVVAELLLLANYYGDLKGKSCTLRIILTQAQLAQILCITREYVSKMLKKLKSRELIAVDREGRISIPNFEKLKKEFDL